MIHKTPKKKPIFEIKVNNWNKRTESEQNKALMWLFLLLGELSTEYRKFGISDEFTGTSS